MPTTTERGQWVDARLILTMRGLRSLDYGLLAVLLGVARVAAHVGDQERADAWGFRTLSRRRSFHLVFSSMSRRDPAHERIRGSSIDSVSPQCNFVGCSSHLHLDQA